MKARVATLVSDLIYEPLFAGFSRFFFGKYSGHKKRIIRSRCGPGKTATLSEQFK
jgi:hypothetical protein